MDKKQFWNAIGSINLTVLPDEIAALQPLERLLVTLSAEDIVDFNRHFSECICELNTVSHFAAALQNQTDTLFFALRCWVVAQGKPYYEEVRKDASRTPPTFVALSGLSKIPQRAWAKKTGGGEAAFSYLPKVLALTFGFRRLKYRWAPAPGTLALLQFTDSRELVDLMLSANRREEPRIGDHHDVVANAYLRQLQIRAFKVRDCKTVSLKFCAHQLNKKLPNGSVASSGRYSDIFEFVGSVEMGRYLILSKSERLQLFVDMTRDALLQIANKNDNSTKIIEDAREAVMRTLAQPPYIPPRYVPVPFAPNSIPVPVVFTPPRTEPVF